MDIENKNTKILIIAATGMLGHKVYAELTKRYGESNISFTYRNREAVKKLHPRGEYQDYFKFDPFQNIGDMEKLKRRCFEGNRPKFDYIINCLGVIKPNINKNKAASVFLNSWLPHELTFLQYEDKNRVIHPSTDCLWDGKSGMYLENEESNDPSLYAKTKSLGESEKNMVLRVSIIGEEIHNNQSLIAWAKSKKGKKVQGYTNHIWNGMTTKEFAKCCIKIIDNDLWKEKVYHIFSPNIINKYELLKMINERFNLGLKISAEKCKTVVDRSLITMENLNKKLKIADIAEQIREL